MRQYFRNQLHTLSLLKWFHIQNVLYKFCGIIRELVQFSWYSWVVLLHDRIYILDENKIYELVFLLKLKTDASTKLHSHDYAKIPQAMKIAPPPFPQNLNDSTVFVRVLRQKKSRLCYLSSLFLIVIQH